MASMLNYLPRNVSWSWVQYGGFDKNKWLASRLMQPKIGTRKNVMGKRRQPAQYWPYIQSADWSIETSSLALGIRCEKGLFYLTTGLSGFVKNSRPNTWKWGQAAACRVCWFLAWARTRTLWPARHLQKPNEMAENVLLQPFLWGILLIPQLLGCLP